MWCTWPAVWLVCALVGGAGGRAAAPPRTLDRTPPELTWRSLLQSPELRDQASPPRRKESLFIAPLNCPKGQRLDRNGCIEMSDALTSSPEPGSQRSGAGAGADEADARYAVQLLRVLAGMRRDALLCDVHLQAAPEPGAAPPPAPLGAHRAVLAASSPYFRALLTQLEERAQPVITIRGVEPAALETILRYVYEPGSLRVTERGVLGLLGAATMLQVEGVRAACCAFLAAALEPDNALGIRAFAEQHACPGLAQRALGYVQRHFVKVIETEEFLALSADTLGELLDSDQIMVPGEEAVLDAVTRWAQHAVGERRAALGALMSRVRLPLLGRAQLVERALTEPLASAPDLVADALRYHALEPEQRAAAAHRYRPRRRCKVLLVMDVGPGGDVSDVDAYHVDAARWGRAPSIPWLFGPASMVSVGGKVYAVRRYNVGPSHKVQHSVLVYDEATAEWAPGPPLQACPSSSGVVAVGHTLYAVGALGLSGVEALDTRAPGAGWRPVAPMGECREYGAAAVLDGRVYALGGQNHDRLLRSVERYDPARDAWEPLADMSLRRYCPAAGALRGALYAVGGCEEALVHSSMERYSPAADRWQRVAPMRHGRYGAGVAVYEDRMYVLGGYDGRHKLSSVEVYDPATDAWTALGAGLPAPRVFAAACVADAPPTPTPGPRPRPGSPAPTQLDECSD